MFADEINDTPTAVPLLDVSHRKRRHFRPPEPAAQEHRQDSPVTQPFGRGRVRRVQQRLGLLGREPVPQADAL
jgi:hypothetical protein